MTAPSYVPLRPTTRLLIGTLVRAYRPIVRRAARAALQGRRCDPTQPQAGRFLRSDVDAILADIWRRVPRLLREDDLDRIPTIGNRHNVFLGALTVAAYHALLERGVEPHYAMEPFADVGWKIYERMLRTRRPELVRAGFREGARADLALRACGGADGRRSHVGRGGPL